MILTRRAQITPSPYNLGRFAYPFCAVSILYCLTAITLIMVRWSSIRLLRNTRTLIFVHLLDPVRAANHRCQHELRNPDLRRVLAGHGGVLVRWCKQGVSGAGITACTRSAGEQSGTGPHA